MNERNGSISVGRVVADEGGRHVTNILFSVVFVQKDIVEIRRNNVCPRTGVFETKQRMFKVFIGN